MPESVLDVIRDERRLRALEDQHILDTEPEPAFDRVARLAAEVLGAESALINFVDADRQWFKSTVGVDEDETGLGRSFCIYTIKKGEPLVIENAAEDERLADNPYVTEDGVRFYAGVPLKAEEGRRIGTLCALDSEPQSPSDEAVRQLSDLAAMVEDKLRLRRERTRRRKAERQKEMKAEFFESIATGSETETVLRKLCRRTQQRVPDTRVSVLRLQDGRLRHVAGPSLPPRYVEWIDGLEIGPSAGTCGTAACTGERVVTEDIFSDPRWEGYRSALEGTELRSCWSVPIRDGAGEVLGTFAMYGSKPARPTDEEQALLHRMAHIASVVLERDQCRRALRENEEQLRMATEGGNIGIWNWDLETGRVVFNRQWAQMLGYSREELDFHFDTWEALVHPEDRPRALEALKRYLSGTVDTYNPEIRMKTAEGEWTWVQTIGKVIDESEDGSVRRAAGVHLDVRDRKQAERDLRQSRRRYRSLFQDSTDAILVHDLEGTVQEVNPRAEMLFGAPAEELKGQCFEDFRATTEETPVGGKTPREALEALREGETYESVSRYERADGSVFWAEVVANKTDVGEETVIRSLIRDVTEREETRRELEQYRTYTGRMLNAIDDLFFAIDSKGRFRRWNDSVPEATGYTDAEIETMTVFDLVPDSKEERVAAEIGSGFTSGHHQIEVPLLRKDGTTVPYEFVGNLVQHPGGLRVVGIGWDITERRRREETLELQNDLFEKAQDIAGVGAWEYNVGAGESFVTDAVYQIHGLSPKADFTAEKGIEFYHPEDRPTIRKAFRQAVDEGESYDIEARLTTGEGEERWVRTQGEPQWENGDIVRVRGTIQDVAERHRRREQRRERRQKVEVLYEATSRLLRAETGDEVADLLVTLTGETLGYSHATIRFAEGDRLEASRVSDMVYGAMPERPAYAVDGDTPAAAAYQTGQTRHFDDLSTARPELDRGDIRSTAYVPMGDHGLISVGSREVGGIDAFDLRLIEILGGYARLVLDRLGRVDSLRTARDAAEEADRIKTALLSNMNHELRTPLTSILTFAELIDQNPGAADQFAGRVLGGARRLLYTLNTVMEFAELEGEVHDERNLSMNERCQLEDTVRSVVGDYRERARQKGVELEADVAKSGTVYLDSHLLERVLTHLVDNSVKFTEDGQIRVTATASEEALELQVEDTGVGIDPGFLPRACDEFAQASTGLARQYEGNGLGLTVTTRLVERVGGTLEIESESDEGTWVTVRLPTGNRS